MAEGVTTQPITIVVVMGVSGCGKSTVEQQLARRTGWPSAEGDDFHPPANVAKMRAGIPLTDAERLPWLRAVAEWISDRARHSESAVVACSALKRSYRDVLRGGSTDIFFLHLVASRDVLLTRLRARPDHFMPAALLQSQLDTLQPLQPDEAGVILSVEEPLEEVVARAFSALAVAGRVPAPGQPP